MPVFGIDIAIMTKDEKSKSQRLVRILSAVVCLPLPGTETCAVPGVGGCWSDSVCVVLKRDLLFLIVSSPVTQAWSRNHNTQLLNIVWPPITLTV